MNRLSPLLSIFLVLLLVMAIARVLLAYHLDLFGDEAFYRWESQILAWSYSDLPPLTALAMKAGSLVGGESNLALRSVFLLAMTLLPLSVYALARPVVGREDALASAILSLLLPPLATLGILAIPDALLLLECTLLLACLERACRLQQMRWWVAAGAIGALGFLTHYRFVFLPLAVTLAFLFYPQLRAQLMRPGPWVTIGIAALGLIPLLVFNLSHQFGALGFHFSERHPWAFHAEGLQYGLLQAGMLSPLLYGLLAWILWQLLRRGSGASPAQALVAMTGLFYIVGIILIAPWMDQTSTTEHWAWFGYIPLLLFAPQALRSLWQRGGVARLCAGATVGMAALFTLLAPLLLALPLFYDSLPLKTRESATLKMVSWSPMRQELEAWYRPGEMIYSSSYYIAAQLRQAPFDQSEVRVIDHEKIHRDGRGLQLEIWQVSERYLPADGSSGLIVMEYDQADRYQVYDQIDVLCRQFDTIESLTRFEHFDGQRRYEFLRGHGAGSKSTYVDQPPQGFCFPPVLGRVDNYLEYKQPQSGFARFNGYLLAQPEGIASMYVRVNGQRIPGNYGRDRPDVLRVLGGKVIDPQYPLVGFWGRIDTRKLPNGEHQMEFVGVTHSGREEVFRRHTLFVEN